MYDLLLKECVLQQGFRIGKFDAKISIMATYKYHPKQ
jgi:hypothetical protein